MKNKLIETYLDYVNNYLTVAVMAEHYGIDPVDMEQIISIGRKLHEANVQRLKNLK